MIQSTPSQIISVDEKSWDIRNLIGNGKAIGQLGLPESEFKLLNLNVIHFSLSGSISLVGHRLNGSNWQWQWQ